VVIVYFCFVYSKNKYINSGSRAWVAAWLVAVLIGISIEIAQSLFTTNRSGEMGDAVANAMGAGFGYVVYQGAKLIAGKRFKGQGSS
jgi:VanZ family protein